MPVSIEVLEETHTGPARVLRGHHPIDELQERLRVEARGSRRLKLHGSLGLRELGGQERQNQAGEAAKRGGGHLEGRGKAGSERARFLQ